LVVAGGASASTLAAAAQRSNSREAAVLKGTAIGTLVRNAGHMQRTNISIIPIMHGLQTCDHMKKSSRTCRHNMLLHPTLWCAILPAEARNRQANMPEACADGFAPWSSCGNTLGRMHAA